ncbi:MAG: hypothetical protein ABW061_03965 [Polyangiaceae bacterium]
MTARHTSTERLGLVILAQAAYVTVVGTAETRRYLGHVHHDLGQWLIEFVKRMR